MKWEYDENGKYWIASKDYGDGCCEYIYTILPVKNGYIAEVIDNAFGLERVAVKNELCNEGSVFKNLKKLMEDIENKNILWFYPSLNEITKEEY